MNKKIFIIAPHFPPSSLPPAQRVRLIVKHAHKLGYSSIVFTTASKYREELDDPWLVQLAGTEYRKIEVKAINQRLTRKIGFGDLGLRLIPFMMPSIIKHARKERPDFILYPVPPWYMLVIAPIIKFFNRIPYGIDFIDPWVDVAVNKNAGIKRRISQKIAFVFERWAVKHASIIYSVSEGINKGITDRYPESIGKKFFAIAYGVEPDDFKTNEIAKIERVEPFVIRYIGAVWDDAYPVLEVLLNAFGNSTTPEFRLEFYGTSYAPGNLATPQLDEWKVKHNLEGKLTELPQRVSYKAAVQLTMGADFLLLFGGMQPYYAASKLMGLLASGKTFIAFLHRDSFPAKILQQINYPFLVLYSHIKGDLPVDHLQEVKSAIKDMFDNKKSFARVDFANDPILAEHTAYGMTKQFIAPINELILLSK